MFNVALSSADEAVLITQTRDSPVDVAKKFLNMPVSNGSPKRTQIRDFYFR